MDGDGAAIMHLGAWATVGQVASPNLKHVVFNNGMHGSVGGQPTAAFDRDAFSFATIAKGCGYKQVLRPGFRAALSDFIVEGEIHTGFMNVVS